MFGKKYMESVIQSKNLNSIQIFIGNLFFLIFLNEFKSLISDEELKIVKKNIQMINQETRPIFQDSEMTNFISVILIRIASLIGIVVNIINKELNLL